MTERAAHHRLERFGIAAGQRFAEFSATNPGEREFAGPASFESTSKRR